MKIRIYSYQEWWRDWPYETRQPFANCNQVLNPTERTVPKDEMKVAKAKTSSYRRGFFIIPKGAG